AEGFALTAQARCPGPCIPDLDRPVSARRGQPAAVGTEGHAPDLVGMPLERAQLLAAGRIPDLDRPIGTRRGQPTAVATEGHAPDHGPPPFGGGMPLERPQLQLAQATLAIPFPAAPLALAGRQ